MTTASSVQNSYSNIGKVDNTFSDVLTINQIRTQHIGRYSPSQVQEVLFFLEELGHTISESTGIVYGKPKYYFYFDNDVKQRLLAELKKRGCKLIRPRNRYPVPTYVKFYSVFQYDREKFRKLLNKWLKTDEGKNRTYDILLKRQREFLEQCWVLDEDNNRKRDCDEPHIFRYRTLHRILECIANCLMNNYGIDTPDMMKYLFNRTNLVIYPFQEGMKPEAELINTIMCDIKTRIRMHLHLLRGLKRGLEVEDAVRLAYRQVCPI